MNQQYIERVIDLTDPQKNTIYNKTYKEAVEIVKSGNTGEVRKIDGQFAIVSVDGKTVRINECKGMWGLGTPEDLDHYLKHYKG